MQIAIGADHAGYELKNYLIGQLSKNKYNITDFGTNSSKPVDYPDTAYAVGKNVSSKKADRGILICGSGVGMSIAANKVKGIRAIVCSDIYTAKQSREHGDVNILCLAGRRLSKKKALSITEIWLNTKFSNEARHKKRIAKIHRIEKG